MITITVQVTADCEGVITALPRYGEWELVDEEYNEDGTGVVVVNSHRWNFAAEVPYVVEQALDGHNGVISYAIEPE